MKITILTLFPEMFVGPLSTSIVKRAIAKKKATIDYINLRDFARDRYKSVDDHPYGGGAGMILRVDVVDRALKAIRRQSRLNRGQTSDVKQKIVLLDPQGTPYTQTKARSLSKLEHLVLICGHYEGVYERVRTLVDEEISIGDYVLTGGELPAMVVVDSVIRLIPGVLPKADATIHESFENGTLEYPQYTRPKTYNSKGVPTVLRSGNHAKIASWRKEQSLKRTQQRRPDLGLTVRKDPL